MATLPTIFLESTLQAAEEHGIEAQALPDNQGLVLWPAGLDAAAQYSLLKKMAADLQAFDSKAPAASPAQGPENSPNPSGQSAIDCQVSVEERAQLFKFLTG